MQVFNLNSIFNFRTFVKYAFISCLLALLTACQGGSLSDGLQSAAKPQQSVGTQSATQVPIQSANPNSLQNNTQVASLPSTKSVAFLPVSNAPQSAVSTLSSSIRSAATQNQVTIVNSLQDGASYQVKGYFSALEDGSGTLLVYVWDVLDKNNKRVYRISGQERSNRKSADPWSAITNQMITQVANNSLSQLKSWLATSG